MARLDMKKTLKHLYTAPVDQAVFVDVPEMTFLAIDGQGDPDASKDFADAAEALFTVAYTVKFMAKRADPRKEFVVMPLEGLWGSGDPAGLDPEDRESWTWTLMIAQPPLVTASLVAHATEEAQRKRNLPALEGVRLAKLNEDFAAQIMHVGPYAEESRTIEKLHAFVEERGYRVRGRHHEIYLSDPKRTAPEKMRTILRHPVGPRR